MKHALALMLLLSLPLNGWGQFVDRYGFALGGGGNTIYGKGLDSAPVSSSVDVCGFIDWQDKVMGFKTTGVWTTYEGQSFRNGALSLEFLPKAQWIKTGLWGGVGVYTVLNAPETAANGSSIGLCGELGWSSGRFMISGRLRRTFSDLLTELDGRQSGLEFGGRVYYALIMN